MAETAIEFQCSGNIARTVAIIGLSANSSRINQAAITGTEADIEQTLVFGKKRAFIAEESFDGIEIDHQLIAFYLAEIRVQGGGQLKV